MCFYVLKSCKGQKSSEANCPVTQKRNGKIYLVSVLWPYQLKLDRFYICMFNMQKQCSLLLNFSDLYSKVDKLNAHEIYS